MNETVQLLNSLEKRMKEYNVPGLQVAICFPSGDLWAEAIGSVDLHGKRKLCRNHIQRLGSVTKTFVSALILQFIQEKELSLDDTLSNWFPECINAKTVSIKQLLSHRSGLPEYLKQECVRLKIVIPLMFEPLELIATVSKLPLEFEPGSQFQYSNTNYILLGLIAERITGKTAAKLLRQRIFDPFCLKDTFFLPDEQPPDRFVSGFDRDHLPSGIREIKPSNPAWATVSFTTGASVSTASDLVLWLNALFTHNVLSPCMLTKMTDFHDVEGEDFTGYGLGLMRFQINGDELWGHRGSALGFSAIGVYSPKHKYSIAVIGNLSKFDVCKIVDMIQPIVVYSDKIHEE